MAQDIRDDIDAVQARRKRPGQAQFRMDAEAGWLLAGGAAAAPLREDTLREVRPRVRLGSLRQCLACCHVCMFA